MALNLKEDMFSQSDVRETITNTEETSIAYNMDYARFDNTFAFADGKGLFINPDGTELYTIDDNDDVKQYTMSTKWDISTATLTHTLDVSAKETVLTGITFKPDGTKMYTSGRSGDSIDEYDLSTAWALSTAVYLQEFDMSGTSTDSNGFYFREDGKQFYVSDVTDNKIYSFNLTTAWDITTAVKLDEVGFTTPYFIFCSRDGAYIFVVDDTNNDVRRWLMSSVFRLSTAVANATFDIFPTMADPRAIFFKANGTKMYVLGAAAIQEYTIKRGWR